MKKLLVWLCMIAAISAYAQTTNIKYQIDGIGTTAGDGKGIWFANTSAATSSAFQYSPSIVLEGQGWQSTTLASQPVRFMQDVVTGSGSANPSGNWRLRASLNNGSYSATPIIQAFADGTTQFASAVTILGNRLLQFTGGTSEIRVTTAGSPLQVSSTYTNQSQANGVFQFRNINGSYTATSGTLSDLGITGSTYAPTSGSAAFNSLNLNNTVNQTGGANGQITWVNAMPTITAAVNVTGYDWNPVNPGNISGNHLAWRNTSGNMLIGGTALSSASALVDMQSTTKGLVIPRVTSIASVTSPVNGMMAYDAATNLFNFRQNGSWVNLGSVTPAGSSGNLQYNNGGTLGGFGDYNSTTDRLTLTGAVRSSNNFALVALGSNNSYTATINWYTGSIGNNGSVTQGLNVFIDDAGVELENRSAIIEFTILLTKADGSNAIMQKDAVYYLKAGTSDPTKVVVKPIYSHGSPSSGSVIISYPNPTTNIPQISISDVLAGGWNVRVTAQVMMSN